MPISFNVPPVVSRLERQSGFGSIADRPSISKTIAKSGKSFTTVNVALSGGPGAPIGRLLIGLN
jgi:hypothetical protein